MGRGLQADVSKRLRRSSQAQQHLLRVTVPTRSFSRCGGRPLSSHHRRSGFKDACFLPGPLITQYFLTNQKMKNSVAQTDLYLKAAGTAAAELSEVRLWAAVQKAAGWQGWGRRRLEPSLDPGARGTITDLSPASDSSQLPIKKVMWKYRFKFHETEIGDSEVTYPDNS